LIYHEFLLRERHAEQPSLEEFTRRFPEHAEALALQVGMHQILEADDGDQSIWLGKYELIAQVGVGSYGTVYKACDRELDRIVAVKVPRSSHLLANEDLERFHREARTVAQLRHPSIVALYEIGQHQRVPFLVTEFVQGSTLEQRLDSFQRKPRETAELVATLADVLHYAHSMGVVHRDIKPANIMMDESGAPRLMDFGLARRDTGDVTMTLDGQVLGTPAYMSPELASGQAHRVDGRNDVYSLGVILYQLLTGRLPFEGTSRTILHQVLNDEPKRPRSLNNRIPHDLETICLRAMAKEPARRYQTARDMADDLRRYLHDEPIQARPIRHAERLWRWCRRNPLVTSLSVGLLCVVLAGIGGIVWKWQEAEQAKRAEQLARQDAIQSERAIRDEFERLKRATRLLERGRQFAEWRRWKDAEKCFRSAIETRPDFAQPWEERGSLYARLGLWELAAADRSRAFSIQQPQLASLHWWSQAVIYAYVGDEGTYRRLLERMRAEFRGSFSAVVVADVARVRCLVPENEPDSSDWFVELAENALRVPDPEIGRLLYIAGLAQFRAGHFEQAIERFAGSLATEKQSMPLALNYPVLAMAYHKLGRTKSAIDTIETAARIRDDWIQHAYDGQADTRVTSSGIDNAWPIPHTEYLEFQLFYREACTMLGVPIKDDYRLHRLRGRAFASVDRRREADAELSEALQLLPDDRKTRRELHYNRGIWYAGDGRYDLAAEAFAAAVQLTPDESRLWRNQAFCHILNGDTDSYHRICQAMLERFGQTDDQSTAHDIVEACVVHPDAISDKWRLPPLANIASSWYVDAVRMRAIVLYRTGQFAESIDCFDKAARLYGLRSWDWVFLAMAHHHLDHPDTASKCLEHARRWMREADSRVVNDLFRQSTWDDWYERPCALKLIDEAVSHIKSR
jgi:tetratricopeptide (TPR) repeat protein/tRNA A-37 threonylcarbamoyl transferase component Bud32